MKPQIEKQAEKLDNLFVEKFGDIERTTQIILWLEGDYTIEIFHTTEVRTKPYYYDTYRHILRYHKSADKLETSTRRILMGTQEIYEEVDSIPERN